MDRGVSAWDPESPIPKTILFLATPDEHIKTDHPILIARAHGGYIAGEEVFALDDLLRTLGDVGAVGERHVVGKLLLDRDLRAARRRVGLGGQSLRINLDPAHSEDFLQPAAHS
jgi:hypothetical protein